MLKRNEIIKEFNNIHLKNIFSVIWRKIHSFILFHSFRYIWKWSLVSAKMAIFRLALRIFANQCCECLKLISLTFQKFKGQRKLIFRIQTKFFRKYNIHTHDWLVKKKKKYSSVWSQSRTHPLRTTLFLVLLAADYDIW